MSTHSIKFNVFDHSFCEMNIYGQSPEYINSLSSLFLVFFGLFGIIFHNKIHDIKMVYTAMIFNGICSFMYHFNNQLGWGLLDRFSMILIALPCYMIGVKILESLKFYSIFYDILRFLIIFYLSYLMTVIGLHHEERFNALFGLFLINLAIFVFFIDKFNKSFNVPKNIIKISWFGIYLIAIAGVFWILTEKFCNSVWFIKYLFGHTIWHFGVSLGGYLVTLLPVYLYNKDNYPVIYYYYNIPYLKLTM